MAEFTIKVTLTLGQETYEALQEDADRSNMRPSRVVKLLLDDLYSNPKFRWNQPKEAWLAMLNREPIPESVSAGEPEVLEPAPVTPKPVAEGVCGCGLAFGYNDGLKHLTMDGEWNPEADTDHFVVEAVEHDA